MQRVWQGIAIAAVVAVWPQGLGGQQAKPVVIWQGQIHLGDNPEAYPKITSAGMGLQVPFKVDAGRKFIIGVKVSDVQTLAGDGHYIEVFAHFPQDSPATEALLGSFRLKDDSGKEKDISFEVAPAKDFKLKPSYYSVRIRVDTSVRFGLWDDFVVKQLGVEQMK